MSKRKEKELRGHITLIAIISAVIILGLGIKVGSML
jgi:hypothetical protein